MLYTSVSPPTRLLRRRQSAARCRSSSSRSVAASCAASPPSHNCVHVSSFSVALPQTRPDSPRAEKGCSLPPARALVGRCASLPSTPQSGERARGDPAGDEPGGERRRGGDAARRSCEQEAAVLWVRALPRRDTAPQYKATQIRPATACLLAHIAGRGTRHRMQRRLLRSETSGAQAGEGSGRGLLTPPPPPPPGGRVQ